jgi:transposase
MTSMNACSRDLRLKTLAAIERGIPRKEFQDLFGISRSTIKRWLTSRRHTGDVETMKIPAGPRLRARP